MSPGPQYRQGPQMYAAPEQQAPDQGPRGVPGPLQKNIFGPLGIAQGLSGLNGNGGLLGKAAPLLAGPLGILNLVQSMTREDAGSADSYAQGAQGLLGIGAAGAGLLGAAAAPYLAAGAAGIGLCRRGESAVEGTMFEGISAGSAWERSKKRMSESDGVMSTIGNGLLSGGDLLLGGATNLVGGALGTLKDVGSFLNPFGD